MNIDQINSINSKDHFRHTNLIAYVTDVTLLASDGRIQSNQTVSANEVLAVKTLIEHPDAGIRIIGKDDNEYTLVYNQGNITGKMIELMLKENTDRSIAKTVRYLNDAGIIVTLLLIEPNRAGTTVVDAFLFESLRFEVSMSPPYYKDESTISSHGSYTRLSLTSIKSPAYLAGKYNDKVNDMALDVLRKLNQ